VEEDSVVVVLVVAGVDTPEVEVEVEVQGLVVATLAVDQDLVVVRSMEE